jgi:hypothetical protein
MVRTTAIRGYGDQIGRPPNSFPEVPTYSFLFRLSDSHCSCVENVYEYRLVLSVHSLFPTDHLSTTNNRVLEKDDQFPASLA